MNESSRQSLVGNDDTFFSLQRTSSCFPTFLLIFVMCFPKFRESFNVTPNKSTVSTSVKQHFQQIVIAQHRAFAREPAPCIFQGSRSSPLTHHHKFLVENMFDNSWISISKIQLIIISIVRQLRLFDEIK